MRILAVLATAALTAPALAASSFSTDVTDLWWNPDESGWGVNVIQENNIAFATFFVYDANSRARWYVASAMGATAASSTGITFQGDLFESNGPYYGVQFNPAAVGRQRVGTATLQVTFPGQGTLTYTVNGATVTKAVQRQTWAANDASGTFEGRRVITAAGGGCMPGAVPFSAFQVTQSPTALAIQGVLGGSSCRFDGDYTQQGRLGASKGSFVCDDGNAGSYSLSEIRATFYGFFARYSGTERGCSVEGRIGGVNKAIRQVAQ